MICDKFITLNYDVTEPDFSKATMRCMDCEELFDVELFILAPKNCRHNLGESLTVICPKCKVEATSTVQEAKITYYTALKDKLNDNIIKQLEHIKSQPQKFEIGGDLAKVSTTSEMDVKCLKCSTQFKASPKTATNAMYMNDKLTIVCPECVEMMTFNSKHFHECMALAHDTIVLASVEKALATLKGEKDGTINTSIDTKARED